MTTIVSITRDPLDPRIQSLVLEYFELGDQSPRAAEAQRLLQASEIARRYRETLALERRFVARAFAEQSRLESRNEDAAGFDRWIERKLSDRSRIEIANALGVFAQQCLLQDPVLARFIVAEDPLSRDRGSKWSIPDRLARSVPMVMEYLRSFPIVPKEALFTSAVEAAESLGVRSGQVLLAKGMHQWFRGDRTEAAKHYRHAAESSSDRRVLAAALNNLALVAIEEGDRDSMLQFARASVHSYPDCAKKRWNLLLWEALIIDRDRGSLSQWMEGLSWHGLAAAESMIEGIRSRKLCSERAARTWRSRLRSLSSERTASDTEEI